MQERKPVLSSYSRRIGSRAAQSETAGVKRPIDRAGGVWTLRLAPLLLLVPLFVGLAGRRTTDVVGLAVALALFWAAAQLMKSGLHEEADYHGRSIARAPRTPRKLLGAGLAGLGAFVASLLATSAGLGFSLVMGAAAGFGCALAYGLDPRRDKGLDPALAERAGMQTDEVIAALKEAEGKLAQIDSAATGLHSRELKERLRRITTQGRRVLAQIEKDPGDLRRARRFLVTYLDGTRDVVAQYGQRQQDLADSPLADNFRRVLDTVEQVFVEQEEVLKRNESLDLEVKIDVLQTQLEREGVH